jgi:hypothetical protein
MNVSPHWTATETELLLAREGEEDDPKCANARGTIDRYCHILAGEPGNYTRTLCGLVLEPSLTCGHEPPPEPCPGGHPSCPECAAAL